MNINLIKNIKKFLLLTGLLVLSACGGGGGGGGGGGNTTPIGVITGLWTVSETSDESACGGSSAAFSSYALNATNQSGNSLTVTNPSGTFTGNISGSTLTWNGSYPEDGGTTTASMTATLDASCNSLSGSATWSWTNGASSCSGTSTFTATRDNPVGCGSGGGGGTISEVEPNDTPAQAQAITLPVTITGSISDSDIFDGFEFTLTGAQTITATLTGGTTTGIDMDLELWNAAGPAFIAQSIGTDSNESITSSLGAGSYQVVVVPFTVPTTTSYTLSVQ